MEKSNRFSNKLKHSMALLMAIVIGASSVNLSAFAEETVSETEAHLEEETESGVAETVELMDTMEETILDTVAEEVPEEIENIDNAEAEGCIELMLDEVTTVNGADIPEDGRVQFRFMPDVSGRYCIEVNGDLEYYEMLLGNANIGWGNGWNKYTEFLEAGIVYECCICASGSSAFDVMVTKGRDIASVEIIKEPYRKSYVITENNPSLSFQGMEMKVIYADGSEEILRDGNLGLADGGIFRCTDDIDWSAPGTYTVNFEIDNNRSSFDISIMSEEDYGAIQGTLLLDTPYDANLEYGYNEFCFVPENEGEYVFEFNQGEWPNPEVLPGIELYCDGTQVDYQGGADGIAAVLDAGRVYVLRLCVTEAVQTKISVKKIKAVTELEIIQLPYKQVYMAGEIIQNDGLELDVTFEDGTSIKVGANQPFSESDRRYVAVDVWNVDSYTPGSYKVKVHCGKAETYYSVQIIDKEEYLAQLPELEEGTVTQVHMDNAVKEFRFIPKKTGIYIFKAIADSNQSSSGFITGGEYVSEYAGNGLKLTAGATYMYSITYGGKGDVLNIEPIYIPKVREFVVCREPYITNYKVRTAGEESGTVLNYSGLKMHIVYEDGNEEDIDGLGNTSYEGKIYPDTNKVNWEVPGDYTVTFVLRQGGAEYFCDLIIHILSEEDYLKSLPKVKEELVNTVQMSSFDGSDRKFEFTFIPASTGYYSIYASEYDGSGVRNLSIDGGNDVLQLQSGDGKYGVELVKGVTYTFSASRSYYSGIDEIDVIITKQERKPIKELVLNSKPKQLTYKVVNGVGTGVNTSGLSVDVVFEDGTRETLENQYMMQDGRQMTVDTSNVEWKTPGTYTCKIVLDGAETSFDVEVQAVAQYMESLPVLSEQTVDLGLQANLHHGKNYQFTPSESGYYQLEISLREWTEVSDSNPTYALFRNPYTDEVIKEVGKYTAGMNGTIYEVYLEEGETYLVSIFSGFPIECSVDIKRVLDVKNVKIVSLPKRTTFSADINSFADVCDADGLAVEIEYTDGTKEILQKGDIGRDGGEFRIEYSYDDFLAKNTTVTVRYGQKSDTYQIKFQSKEDYLANTPVLGKDGQEFSVDSWGMGVYQFDISEDGLYEFIFKDSCDVDVRLYNDAFSQMFDITSGHNYCEHLRTGKYYLCLSNRTQETQSASVEVKKLKNVRKIEVANKDVLITQKPWILGVSNVDDYKEDLQLRLFYDDGTTEVIDAENTMIGLDNRENSDTCTIWVTALELSATWVVPAINPKDLSEIQSLNVDDSVVVKPIDGQSVNVYKFTVPETNQYYISYNRTSGYSGHNQWVMLLTDENGEWSRKRSIWNYEDIVQTLREGETYYVVIPNDVSGGNLRIASQKLVVDRDELQEIYYNGKPQKPNFKVNLAGKALEEGKDYGITYVNNVEAGNAYAVIKPLKANTFPEYYVYFKIEGKKLFAEDIFIESVKPQTYTGAKITPAVVIKDGDKLLKLDRDYEVYYEKNIDIGTARMIIRGIGNYTGRVAGKFEIVEKIGVSEVVLDKNALTFTAKGQSTTLKATVSPADATDKGITWSSSNEKVVKVNNSGVVTPVANGTAVITVKAKDSGKTAICKVTVKFPTVATLTNLKAVTGGPSKVKLTWNAVSGAEGYLVYAQKNGQYGYVGMTTKGTTYTDTKALTNDYNFYWVFPYVKDANGNMYAGGCQSYKYAKGGVCPAVTNLKAVSEIGQVRLTWKASAGAEGYLVYGKTATGKYGYIGMTTKGTTYVHKSASKTEYNFYWVFPYHRDANGKMIVGGTPKYVYGKAK